MDDMTSLFLNLIKKHFFGLEAEKSKIRLDPLPGIIAPTAAPPIPRPQEPDSRDEHAAHLRDLYARFQKSQEGKAPISKKKKSLDGS